MTIFSWDTIAAALGAGGVLFGIYSYFHEPDIKADKEDALINLRIQNINERLCKITENELPHIDQKLNNITDELKQVSLSLARLQTIIEERVPRKP